MIKDNFFSSDFPLTLTILLLLEPRLINDLKVIIVVISGHNCYLPAL